MILWAILEQMINKSMSEQTTVIASGNLATTSRTINGVLSQLALLKVSKRRALQIFTQAGLPATALQQPDFPISLQQELVICSALVTFLGADISPVRAFFHVRQRMGIEALGVLGMAMRHADTTLDALRICVTFPQLSWGHSRMVVSTSAEATVFTFTMQRPTLRDTTPQQLDRLVQYGLALDVVHSLRNIEDILDGQEQPLYISFPFAQPDDWAQLQDDLPCPVHFAAADACLVYPNTLQGRSLPRANPLVYRSFVSIAEKLSLMLAEDISLSERVTRWLWAYSPPLRRGAIARQLATSERSITRQLQKEGTSYAALLAAVQQERAENFLRNPTLSVSAIAYRLGYTEPAAFTRAFTQWSGLSPLRWRQQL